MTLKRMLPLATVLSVLAVLLAVPTQAADDEEFDIVGLRLGMNYDEVIAALAANNFDVSKVLETRESYNYSDGIKHNHRTGDFLTTVQVTNESLVGNQQKSDFLRVIFSPPPEGGHVVAITRTVRNEVDPPTNGQYKQAVHDKYGAPAEDRNGTGKWFFGEGAMDCLPAGLPDMTGRNKQNILMKVFMNQAGEFYLDRFANARVKALEECANTLTYSVGFSDDKPATRVSAIMVDVQSWVRAELAASAWVEGLRQEAIRLREDGADKPAL